MSIRWKLGIIFLIISLVPLTIFAVISIDGAQQMVKQEIGLNFDLIAREKALGVASVLNRRVDEAIGLAQHPRIIAAVVAANASYRGETDDGAVSEITRIDRAWIQAKGDLPLADNILGGDISAFLRDYQGRDPLEYGEIFITDRLGATVAMTSTLTDYYQADEGWWREGFAGGEGAVYIDDRGYDISVGAVVTGVVVPVWVGGEVLGLLKINFKMAHIPAIISNPYGEGDVRVFMLRSNGTAVIDPSGGQNQTASPPEARVMAEKAANGWLEDEHDLNPTIMGYALVQPEKGIYTRTQAETSQKGVTGETWGETNWYVFVERNRAKAYAPLSELMTIFIFGGVVMAIAVVFMAGATASTITGPLLKLRKGMESIAAGNLDFKVGGDREDEIGDVQRDIDLMVGRLKETLASRDELNREIVLREKVERALKTRSQQLEHSKAEADRANQAKSSFLASMSHELRTPLNAILGFAQMLELSPKEPLSDKQKDATRQIIKGGEHLLDLINDVLNLAQIESGRMDLSIGPVDSRELVDECISAADALIHKQGVTINADGFTGSIIQADPVRFKQVMLNLLSNAVKYNRKGGKVTVTGAITDGAMQRISVADTGPGIPADKQSQLFQPFSRLGAENSTIEGTGIGLIISLRLIESMDGRMGFESAEGAGSAFWLELPLAAHQPSEASAGPAVKPEMASGGAGKVLYVEDNPANLALMETILADMPGVELLTAGTAELGLAMATRDRPDLILMDINLPGMNGIEALAELRRHNETRDIPVIAVTANAMPDDVRRGKEAGFLAYLIKPFNITELIDRISDVLSNVRK